MTDDRKLKTAQTTQEEFVKKIADWFLPKDSELRDTILAHRTLKGLYTGKSTKIHRLIQIAYGRGVRNGVGLVWSANQKVTTR